MKTWICEECGRQVGPNRVRLTTGFASTAQGYLTAKRVEHAFCPDCHRDVLSAADSSKYPDLFEREARWVDEMAEWQTASEMAALIGVPGGRSFSNEYVNNNGQVRGWKFERVKSYDDDKTKGYRVYLYRAAGLA